MQEFTVLQAIGILCTSWVMALTFYASEIIRILTANYQLYKINLFGIEIVLTRVLIQRSVGTVLFLLWDILLVMYMINLKG